MNTMHPFLRGRRPAVALVAAAMALALGGCSGTARCEKPEPYQTATVGGPLAVPDDLASPQASGKYTIPQAGQAGVVRGPCGDLPPMAPDAMTREAGAVAAADDAGPLPTLDTDVSASATDSGVGPIAVSGSIERDIRESVIAWMTAWREGDGRALVSFYASDFESPLGEETREEWAARRAALISEAGPVDARYDLLTINETFAGVTARFVQEFHDRGKIDAVVKTLEFKVEDGRWRIARERVLEVL